MSSRTWASLSRGVLMRFLRLFCKRGRQQLHWVAHTACTAWGPPSFTARCSNWSSRSISSRRFCGITTEDWGSVLEQWQHSTSNAYASTVYLDWIRMNNLNKLILNYGSFYSRLWNKMACLHEPTTLLFQLERTHWLFDNQKRLLRLLNTHVSIKVTKDFEGFFACKDQRV